MLNCDNNLYIKPSNYPAKSRPFPWGFAKIKSKYDWVYEQKV